jgi:hypothetical protein
MSIRSWQPLVVLCFVACSAAPACFSPNYDPDGRLLCSVPDSQCPVGQHCVDGHCWKHPPGPDLGTPFSPDLAMPPTYLPAAVWISTGGGSSTGSGGGRLNLSLPGAAPVGSAKSIGGGTASAGLGYLASDTQ